MRRNEHLEHILQVSSNTFQIIELRKISYDSLNENVLFSEFLVDYADEIVIEKRFESKTIIEKFQFTDFVAIGSLNVLN